MASNEFSGPEIEIEIEVHMCNILDTASDLHEKPEERVGTEYMHRVPEPRTANTLRKPQRPK